MDIPALSMALSQSRLMTDWGTAMMSKSLDMAKETGAAVTDMLESASAMELSVNPDIGGNIDIRL